MRQAEELIALAPNLPFPLPLNSPCDAENPLWQLPDSENKLYNAGINPGQISPWHCHKIAMTVTYKSEARPLEEGYLSNERTQLELQPIFNLQNFMVGYIFFCFGTDL